MRDKLLTRASMLESLAARLWLLGRCHISNAGGRRMNGWLLAAAVLTLAVGAAHSYLGARYILIRLFRRADLPHLFGSDVFTRRTLRLRGT